jgi:hypothetical protein
MSLGIKPSTLDVKAIWRFLLQQAAAVGVELPKGSQGDRKDTKR